MSALVTLALVALAQGTPAERWRFHFEEQAIQELWVRVSRAHAPRTVLFEHARLVRMDAPEVEDDMALLARDGRIAWIGPSSDAEAPDDALRVDASGRFLMPGLVDMHVHRSTTMAMPLLSLANGVTSERDMNGYPWQLAQRERIRAGELLAPDLHLAGHILNGSPMGMYATVVTEPEQARAVVREHVAAGYDFVKVHNVLDLEVWRAVLDEAQSLGVRVVGHIPQSVTLEEAIARGQHTFEHFKGYLLDRTLTMTSEDYVALTDGSGAWNCPTLSTYLIGLVGDEAYEWIDTFEGMRYVPIAEREAWAAAAETADPNSSHARVWRLSQEIFTRLLETDARFLAGSDSGGGYEHQAPGFMLHEELRAMEELGLSTFECLRAATTNAAEALETESIGRLAVGRRADLLLLDANPLATVANLRHPAGVLAGGVWLPRATLDEWLEAIESIYARAFENGPPEQPNDDDLAGFLERMRALHDGGFVFMDHHLDEIGGLLRARGREDDATRVQGMRTRLR